MTLSDPSTPNYGYHLSIYAATLIFGPSQSIWRDGSPIWAQKLPGEIFGRYVPIEPNDDKNSFRPDVDSRHSNELINYAMDLSERLLIPVNYRPQYIYRQLPIAPDEIPIHPRPQVRLWHSIYLTSPRKNDKVMTGELFEHIDVCKELADTIATLKLIEWLMEQSK